MLGMKGENHLRRKASQCDVQYFQGRVKRTLAPLVTVLCNTERLTKIYDILSKVHDKHSEKQHFITWQAICTVSTASSTVRLGAKATCVCSLPSVTFSVWKCMQIHRYMHHGNCLQRQFFWNFSLHNWLWNIHEKNISHLIHLHFHFIAFVIDVSNCCKGVE